MNLKRKIVEEINRHTFSLIIKYNQTVKLLYISNRFRSIFRFACMYAFTNANLYINKKSLINYF